MAGVDIEGDVDVDGEGVLELTVTAVSGTGVLLACSGETVSAVCIALGYKSPDTIAGAAVIIVTNKNTEMTGTRRSDHLKFFKFINLSKRYYGDRGFNMLLNDNRTSLMKLSLSILDIYRLVFGKLLWIWKIKQVSTLIRRGLYEIRLSKFLSCDDSGYNEPDS